MPTLLESGLTPEQHAWMKKTLVAQTQSLGMLEMPIVADLLKKHRCRKVLDIGCGEGSFLIRLAKDTKNIRYVGVDHSETLIEDARVKVRRRSLKNVDFKIAFFNQGFERAKYDAVTTRYVLQHATNSQSFLDAVYRRLQKKGVFIAVESLDAYADCHERDLVWERYKASVAAVHREVGSNADIGKSLGKVLKNAGFEKIHVCVLLCSPSTVGWKRFRSVVGSTAGLANAFFPEIFDRELLQDVEQWLDDRGQMEQKDPYVCSVIADAVKR